MNKTIGKKFRNKLFTMEYRQVLYDQRYLVINFDKMELIIPEWQFGNGFNGLAKDLQKWIKETLKAEEKWDKNDK